MTNVASIESWDQLRKLGYNLFDYRIKKNENQFFILLIYVCFIMVYLIGLSGNNFKIRQ